MKPGDLFTLAWDVTWSTYYENGTKCVYEFAEGTVLEFIADVNETHKFWIPQYKVYVNLYYFIDGQLAPA